jgi:hypothetical protein
MAMLTLVLQLYILLFYMRMPSSTIETVEHLYWRATPPWRVKPGQQLDWPLIVEPVINGQVIK